jgi:hypothetical protein
MSTATQLDFFEPYDESNALRNLVVSEKESNRKTAKKLFALNSQLRLEVMLLRSDLEWLKAQVNKKTEILSFNLEK